MIQKDRDRAAWQERQRALLKEAWWLLASSEISSPFLRGQARRYVFTTGLVPSPLPIAVLKSLSHLPKVKAVPDENLLLSVSPCPKSDLVNLDRSSALSIGDEGEVYPESTVRPVVDRTRAGAADAAESGTFAPLSCIDCGRPCPCAALWSKVVVVVVVIVDVPDDFRRMSWRGMKPWIGWTLNLGFP